MDITDEAEVPKCLVLSDGRRGIENQALGLAERCASLKPLSILTHHISHGKVAAAFPPKVQGRLGQYNLPDCDMAIGCGRQAIAPLLFLKANHANKVMTVYVQDPRIDPLHFDLVIAPTHDGLTGPNVQTQHLNAALNLLKAGYALLITVSRRTPEFAQLAWKKVASEHKRVWLYDGEGPNPYFAFLGGAEMILVTEDSTNMLTEACATGKPVFRLPMSGKAGKFQTLYDALEARCGVTRYAGQLGGGDYPPLDETSCIAKMLWSRFEAFKG